MIGTEIFLLAVIFFALIFDRLNIFLSLITSSILHEVGHIFAHLLLVDKKPKVDISIFGIRLNASGLYGKTKVIILFCGPLVNFVIILACQVILLQNFYLNVYIFMCVNAAILVFNLLPIQFLDGGQLLSTIVDNYYIEMSLSVLSLILMLAIIFVFSVDIYYSLCAVSVFLIYYIMNTVTGI